MRTSSTVSSGCWPAFPTSAITSVRVPRLGGRSAQLCGDTPGGSSSLHIRRNFKMNWRAPGIPPPCKLISSGPRTARARADRQVGPQRTPPPRWSNQQAAHHHVQERLQDQELARELHWAGQGASSSALLRRNQVLHVRQGQGCARNSARRRGESVGWLRTLGGLQRIGCQKANCRCIDRHLLLLGQITGGPAAVIGLFSGCAAPGPRRHAVNDGQRNPTDQAPRDGFNPPPNLCE